MNPRASVILSAISIPKLQRIISNIRLADCITPPELTNYYNSQNLFKYLRMELQTITLAEFESLLASDTQKLTPMLEKVFRDLDKINRSFEESPTEVCSKTNSNTDVLALSSLFQKYFQTGKGGSVIEAIVILLRSIKGKEGLKEVMKSGRDLRFLMIIILIGRIFDFEEREATMVLAETVSHLSSECRKVIVKWLHPMTDVELLRRVESLQTLLSIELLKLMPDDQEEVIDNYKEIDKNVTSLCKLMEIFFLTNQEKPRITNDHFLNSQVTENVDPLSQVKLSFKKINELNFTRYPFLLDLNYKSKLLELEYKIEQAIMLQKGIHNLNSGILSQADLSGNLTLDKILFLHFEVRRDNLLEDSISQLSKTKSSLKKPLRIAFTDEPGIDEGGVKAEYFQLITKQILNPNLGMFLPKNNSRIYWFNGNSFQPPINFEFVGTLLGLSIYNQILLDLPFPKIIYKKLLSKGDEELNSLEDLEEIQPDIKTGLDKILAAQDLSQLELTFQITTESFGELIYHELKPKGGAIAVTKENREEYVALYANFLLNTHIEKQFKAFKQGFFKVVTGYMIKVFYSDELEKIICGDEVLDFKALEKSTAYEGYTSESKTVKWFWEIIQDMDIEMKKAFLFFCTGNDRSPINGLGSIGFVVQRQGPDTDNLPTAHTCNNVFMLPQYNSKQKLRQKLEITIKNNVGFGLI